MEKTVLKDVYALLKQLGAVASESEFSTDWLCRSECYVRSLRFTGNEPSIGSVAICASKLQHYAGLMGEQHRDLAAQFLRLSDQCHLYINRQSRRKWLL